MNIELYLKYFLYITVGTIVVDLILGIQSSFGNSTPFLVFFYQLLYFIKLFLVCVSIYAIQSFWFSPVFVIIIMILGSKAIFGLTNITQPSFYITHLLFYLYIICGYMLSSFLVQNKIKFPLISGNLIWVLMIVSALLIIIFYLLYSVGLVPRLALGFQIYILLPILLAYKASNNYLIITFFMVILTGKRGVLLIFLALLGLNMNFKFSVKHLFFFLPILLSLIVFFSYLTGILQRFEPFLILAQEIDLSDFENLVSLLYFATSGRSDEIISYLSSGISLSDILIGQNPGSYFFLFDSGNSKYTPHHFFHVSPLNYIFHFGLFLGSIIILIQLKVFIWSIKAFQESKNLMFGFYQALYITSFFGAIAVVDILFWISFFYSYFSMKQLNTIS